MSEASREMTLEEWVNRLHPNHSARKEYETWKAKPPAPERREDDAEAAWKYFEAENKWLANDEYYQKNPEKVDVYRAVLFGCQFKERQMAGEQNITIQRQRQDNASLWTKLNIATSELAELKALVGNAIAEIGYEKHDGDCDSRYNVDQKNMPELLKFCDCNFRFLNPIREILLEGKKP